jgi:two-component system, NtrC family, response regulator GlrR
MPSCRLFIATTRDWRCLEPGCNQLPAIVFRLFPNAEVESCELGSGNGLETATAPALVLLQIAGPSHIRASTQEVRYRFPQTPVVGVLCNFPAFTDLSTSLNDDLDDYICCPFREEELRLRLIHLLAPAISASQTWQDFRKDIRFQGLVGDSPLFRHSLEQVQDIAACDCTCLIDGETGTGKELFARAIHYLGPRKSRPFVPVNCGALPENLIENELFGHVKGAYTDAGAGGIGLLPFAEDGTLFLDEIDALSLSSQAKLLRVLQEHEYRPVGSPRMHTTKARILAATNSDLRVRIKGNQFREDLFHRLNILRLSLPKLSDRNEDIPMLACYFLRLYAERQQKSVRDISAAALHKLMSYHWPGNVRELQSVIQRALLLVRGARLEARDIDLQEILPERPESKSTTSDLAKAKSCMIERFERSYLTQLMVAHRGNVSRAARAAGRERRTLQRLLRKYQISSAAYRAAGNTNSQQAS